MEDWVVCVLPKEYCPRRAGVGRGWGQCPRPLVAFPVVAGASVGATGATVGPSPTTAVF